MSYILAIDQGTSSSRALLFDQSLNMIDSAQRDFTQHYPASGWVEHEPDDLLQTTLEVCKTVLARNDITAEDLAGIGITNQRETTVLWDRKTGTPIYRAIVWQDRRTAAFCQKLKQDGHEPLVRERTGLLLDPYFSGTKIAWILDNVPDARARAARGELAFGTVDTFLLWHLTGGREHKTDATNASRTMLCNIHTGQWDQDMLALLDVPTGLLPGICDSGSHFGLTDPALFGHSVPVLSMVGDQQAATIGQACFEPGMMKSTYGTGCFALLNTGHNAVTSNNRLLTTIAYQLHGQRTYALEGSIFVAGAAVQWLRDGLRLIEKASDSGGLAAQADPSQEVILVPAFVGLGSPWWNADARGGLFGLTRNTGPKELALAVLESVAFQTADLMKAMQADWPQAASTQTILRVDGGMTASDFTMQRLADLLDAPVDRPRLQETTALGAAYLAGYTAGLLPEPAEFAKTWQSERRFSPAMDAAQREHKLKRWHKAVTAVLSMVEDGSRNQ
jgi:glycerol kinase